MTPFKCIIFCGAMLMMLMVTANVNSCQYSQYSPKHTMCAYQSPGCPLRNKGLSKYEIQFIVDEHNMYRQRIANGHQKQGNQPHAADMRQLEWDNELASVAQKWAEQCKTQHDCSDCRQLPRFRVGQNIYMYASTEDNVTTDWRTAVYEWYKEVSIFPSNKIEPFQHPQAAGHYTQLGWAATYKIGCGFAYYQKGEWFTKLYVCDYGPTGNVLGDRMYIKGPACSACPEGTSCSRQYTGLCASGGGQSTGHNYLVPVPTVAQKFWFSSPASPPTAPPTSPIGTLVHHLPWWLSTAATAATTTTNWSKPPRTPTKKVLLSCDFDFKGCNPETMGATAWYLQRSNSVYGNYYDTQVHRGSDAHLYIYAANDDHAILSNGPSTFSKACLSFMYKKYPLDGQLSTDLEVAVWRHGHRDAVAEYKINGMAIDWAASKMTIPGISNVYSVSFHLSVPISGHFGTQYVAVDQIRSDAGPCN